MTHRRACALFILPLLLLTLMMSAGCGSKEIPPVNPEQVKADLIGKTWTCEMMFQRETVGDNKPVIEFLPDGTVKGNGSCNTFGGTYTLDGDSISFGPFRSTKKSCGAATNDQEFTFLTFLSTIKRLKVEDGELMLYSESNPAPMVFTTGSGGLLW